MSSDGSRSYPHLGPLQRSMGIELEMMGDGRCAVYVAVTDAHLNKGGVAHGGLHATLLDTAMGGATVAALSEEEWCATAQLDISYIEAARVGTRLNCEARVLRRGRGIAHVEGEISDQEGAVIAKARGTWGIWPSRPSHLKK